MLPVWPSPSIACQRSLQKTEGSVLLEWEYFSEWRWPYFHPGFRCPNTFRRNSRISVSPWLVSGGSSINSLDGSTVNDDRIWLAKSQQKRVRAILEVIGRFKEGDLPYGSDQIIPRRYPSRRVWIIYCFNSHLPRLCKQGYWIKRDICRRGRIWEIGAQSLQAYQIWRRGGPYYLVVDDILE